MFYTVVRQFFKNGEETHSMEIKQTEREAEQRYYSIIAADIIDSAITYNACYIIRSDGVVIKGEVFNNVEV